MSVDTEGQETYDTLNCEGEKNSGKRPKEKCECIFVLY